MRTDDLRKIYLKFFKAKAHEVFPSDSLVPDDPSVFFTSAGMNQFKPYFLGEKREVTRAASCQKCLRTGDLENVGKTPYHHTFFEMLGNFSFGDYFKKEAIEFAWEFLTQELKIAEKDLWVSVYRKDLEAYKIWEEHIGVVKTKIVKLGEKSNFWPANAPLEGPDGPCGPCSEIFFDRGKDTGCRKKKCNPDCSCGRFVEIWNLVFTQFNRAGKNKLEPLPQKNIDTGMGLERMASVLQGKASNFEIDILAPLVEFVDKEVVKSSKPEKLVKNSLNAIVDHARAATFAICDGIYPSNEDRGYVIRKIIRRALLSSRALGNQEPFLYRLPEKFAELMKDQYPEIKENKGSISKIIFAEEEKYFSMLEVGKTQARVVIDRLSQEEKEKILGAADLFFLYDTYGLPLEFIQEFAAARGFKTDEKGFKSLLNRQQERSREKSKFEKNIFKAGEFNLEEKSEFIGYNSFKSKALILRLLVDGQDKKEVLSGQEALMVLDKTPFYPQAGGQLSDKGVIQSDKGEFKVYEVFKSNQAIIHKGVVSRGRIEKGEVLAVVDTERREKLARAHTATHLLQAALRKVLGNHVIQQGSLVDEDKLRFDFTHFSKLSDEELRKVEDLVREFIKSSQPVEKKELGLSQAKKAGALAYFKDKYQDKVRMVSMSDYSKELCGGLHVENTSEIENFIIISEASISSGIRRIRALVGVQAAAYQSQRPEQNLEAAKQMPQEDKKVKQEKIGQLVLTADLKITPKDIEAINGIQCLFNFENVEGSLSSEQSQAVLMLSDRLKQRFESLFIFIARAVEGKNIFICSATDDLISKGINCKDFVFRFGKELSLVGGGTEKSVKGAILNRGDDFLERVKGAFDKFTKQ